MLQYESSQALMMVVGRVGELKGAMKKRKEIIFEYFNNITVIREKVLANDSNSGSGVFSFSPCYLKSPRLS